MTKIILCNKIQTPDGTILESRNRHDYHTYLDKNGELYMVDGGHSYLRRNVNTEPAKELSVNSDDDHELIREHFTWGTRGKDGKQPLVYKPLKDLTTDHIEAILNTQTHISDVLKDVFIFELFYRGTHEIR